MRAVVIEGESLMVFLCIYSLPLQRWKLLDFGERVSLRPRIQDYRLTSPIGLAWGTWLVTTHQTANSAIKHKFSSADLEKKVKLKVLMKRITMKPTNIARGTTDPGYCLINLSYLSSLKLALVPILITRWRNLHWLQNYPPDGATCMSCKFGHQLVLLALVANLATRWRH